MQPLPYQSANMLGTTPKLYTWMKPHLRRLNHLVISSQRCIKGGLKKPLVMHPGWLQTCHTACPCWEHIHSRHHFCCEGHKCTDYLGWGSIAWAKLINPISVFLPLVCSIASVFFFKQLALLAVQYQVQYHGPDTSFGEEHSPSPQTCLAT